MEVSRLVVPAVSFGVLLALLPPPARAFNSLTHEQITRNAITYLRSHPHAYAETAGWLSDGNDNQLLMEEALVRAVVDADFRTDLWLGGWFHQPFVGASHKEGFTLFAGMSHFLNVTVKGDYWENDGYAYRHTDRVSPDDSFLSTPSGKVEGAISAMLGGHDEAYPVHGIPLGAYTLGFKGSRKDWRKLYDGHSLAKAVFPPANVPAQLAFDALLNSPRAEEDRTESWTSSLPLITGVFSTAHLSRHYWRGEIKHLPAGFDLLGLALHMIQDVHVPQHASGTADWCHQELEDLIDRLACDIDHNVDAGPFRDGTFDGVTEALSCNFLYDERLVTRLLGSMPALDARSKLSLGERVRAIAFESARWKWGEPNDSVDFMGTVLPDGTELTGNSCAELLNHAEISRQAKLQYNLAVAASVTVFELAAHEYETRSDALFAFQQRIPQNGVLDLFKLLGADYSN